MKIFGKDQIQQTQYEQKSKKRKALMAATTAFAVATALVTAVYFSGPQLYERENIHEKIISKDLTTKESKKQKRRNSIKSLLQSKNQKPVLISGLQTEFPPGCLDCEFIHSREQIDNVPKLDLPEEMCMGPSIEDKDELAMYTISSINYLDSLDVWYKSIEYHVGEYMDEVAFVPDPYCVQRILAAWHCLEDLQYVFASLLTDGELGMGLLSAIPEKQRPTLTEKIACNFVEQLTSNEGLNTKLFDSFYLSLSEDNKVIARKTLSFCFYQEFGDASQYQGLEPVLPAKTMNSLSPESQQLWDEIIALRR